MSLVTMQMKKSYGIQVMQGHACANGIVVFIKGRSDLSLSVGRQPIRMVLDGRNTAIIFGMNLTLCLIAISTIGN